jgi:hypothetical protein
MATVLDSTGQRIRRLTLSMGVGVALLAAACGGTKEEGAQEKPPVVVEEKAPTVVDLNGIWLQVEDTSELGLLVRFRPDGRFAIDNGGQLHSDPAVLGTHRVDGDTITFTIGGGHACTPGDSWAWRASLPENGRLKIAHPEEAAGNCRVPTGTEWTLIRLLPRTYVEGSAAIRAITEAGSGEGRPTTVTELAGIWFSPETPLVALNRDGTFVIDSNGDIDTDPAVRGTFEVDGDTSTFTIGGGHACVGGDTWTWQTSVSEEGLLHIVHGEEAKGNCRVPSGTEWDLIRVSPSSPASAEASAAIIAAGTAE